MTKAHNRFYIDLCPETYNLRLFDNKYGEIIKCYSKEIVEDCFGYVVYDIKACLAKKLRTFTEVENHYDDLVDKEKINDEFKGLSTTEIIEDFKKILSKPSKINTLKLKIYGKN